jgi:hypothetical protein
MDSGFSSPSDAPRVRWRTDPSSAGFIAATLVVLMIVAGTLRQQRRTPAVGD